MYMYMHVRAHVLIGDTYMYMYMPISLQTTKDTARETERKRRSGQYL